MSASAVDPLHVNALVYAGLALCRPDERLRWFVRRPTSEEKSAAYLRGSWIGPGGGDVYQQLVRELSRQTAGRVGAMLLAENARSLNHRYDEDDWEPVFEYVPLRGTPLPAAVLGALAYYEYQSCEHPEWDASEALAFCEALRRMAISRLPGFEWVCVGADGDLATLGVSR